MKTRNGFVSNSSSSSFVVLFPRKPKNAKDVQTMLAGDKEYIAGNPAEQVAETVYSSIKYNPKDDFVRLMYVLERAHNEFFDEDDDPILGVFGKDVDLSQFKNDKGETASSIINKAYVKRLKRDMDEELLQVVNGEGVLYHFQYGDESGPYFSDLEHDGTFDNLPHVRISHH